MHCDGAPRPLMRRAWMAMDQGTKNRTKAGHIPKAYVKQSMDLIILPLFLLSKNEPYPIQQWIQGLTGTTSTDRFCFETIQHDPQPVLACLQTRLLLFFVRTTPTGPTPIDHFCFQQTLINWSWMLAAVPHSHGKKWIMTMQQNCDIQGKCCITLFPPQFV